MPGVVRASARPSTTAPGSSLQSREGPGVPGAVMRVLEPLLHVGVVLERDGDEEGPSRKPLRSGLPGGVLMRRCTCQKDSRNMGFINA